MTDHAAEIHARAVALEVAFLTWAASIPAEGPFEHRARMQVHRELTALTVRLDRMTQNHHSANGVT